MKKKYDQRFYLTPKSRATARALPAFIMRLNALMAGLNRPLPNTQKPHILIIQPCKANRPGMYETVKVYNPPAVLGGDYCPQGRYSENGKGLKWFTDNGWIVIGVPR